MHILLVDDHALFREALLHVLNQLDSPMVILEAGNITEAVQLITRTRNFDLVLLDIELPGTDGLTALPTLCGLAPSTPIVVLSGSEDSQDVAKALKNGAVGFIPKSCSGHEMLTALRVVMQGDIFVPTKLLGKLENAATENIDPLRKVHILLTARQIEVLELMAQGLPNKSIARSLNVAEGTTKLHVAAVLKALGARNRTEAVMEASRLGLVTIPQ